MLLECSACSALNRVPARRLRDGPKCGKCKANLSLPVQPVTLDSAAAFHELVDNAPVPVVIDFWAPWCNPCRILAPELEKIARAKAGQIVVAKVNTDDLPELGHEFAVRGIPTLICFRRGREDKRVTGAMSAPALQNALGLG
jgi:thioredoxin 2